MITTRYVDVAFCGGRSSMARALYQYDYGQILRITDLDLPVAYEVHFAEGKTGNSVTQIGNADGVNIPDSMLLKSGSFYAWFYLHETSSDGETRYEILFPVMQRAKPTNETPTPVQQDAITEAIAALNAAVEQTGADVIAAGESASAAADSADEASGYASDASASAINAGEYAEDAQVYASDASASATAAQNAQIAAETAKGKAETAQGKAESAQTAAEAAAAQTALDVIAAGQSADAAAGSAGEASGYANDASGYATAAQGYASDASGYSNDASGYATQSYNSATAAAGSAGEASGYATTASGYATSANDAKIAAQGAQTAAETAQGLAEAAQTGAEAAQTAAETARDAAIAATEDKAPVILDNASGEIVSIVDGAQGMNARSLVVGMEPIQDLHGYSNPWPAGDGKNKFNYDSVYSAFKVAENSFSGNSVSIETIATSIPSDLVNKELTWSAYIDLTGLTAPTNYRTSVIVGGVETRGNAISAGSAGYSYVTFTPTSTSDTVKFTHGSGQDTIKIKDIQLEIGSARTAWSPYSNICPISGRTGVTVTRTGANLCDPAAKTKSSNTVYEWYAGEGFPAKAGTYTLSTDSSSVAVYVKYLDGTDISGGHATETFTLAQDARIYFRMYKASDASSVNLMLNLGSTALPYEPYVSASYPVTWQTEAGTVYGGTVDLVSGVLTVTTFIIPDTLSSKATKDSSDDGYYWYTTLSGLSAPDISAKNAGVFCNRLRVVNNISSTSDDGGICIYSSGIIRWKERGDLSEADYRTYLASNPLQICYELATPQTYQLDPQTVSMLLGANNVWATGDTVDLTYPCDTKLFIMRMLG